MVYGTRVTGKCCTHFAGAGWELTVESAEDRLLAPPPSTNFQAQLNQVIGGATWGWEAELDQGKVRLLLPPPLTNDQAHHRVDSGGRP